MKKLQILGPGCPRCKKLAELTEEAARSIGLNYELEKVTDIGILMTPTLLVDGEVKIAGKVPSLKELIKILS